MKNAVVVLGKDDAQIPRVLEKLAALALPDDGFSPGVLLLTLAPIGGRQGEHQQGEQDVHAHRACRVLGRMLQTPLVLALLDTVILDEATVDIIVEWLQGLVHQGIGQKDRFAPLGHSLARATCEPPRH
jgi:hypothetical protein